MVVVTVVVEGKGSQLGCSFTLMFTLQAARLPAEAAQGSRGSWARLAAAMPRGGTPKKFQSAKKVRNTTRTPHTHGPQHSTCCTMPQP
jgi:hypothetical protein